MDQVGEPSQVAADQAAVAVDQVSLAQAKTNLTDAELTSPIAGTVVDVNLSDGQSVSAGATTVSAATSSSSSSSSSGASSSGAASSGSSSSSSTAQVVIEPAGTYVVDAEATTAQIGDVQVGEQAIITPVGGTAEFYGIVSSFSIYGTTTSGVTSFPVTILVTGSSSGLYPGASADVELVIRQVNNVLEVPTSAVHTQGTSSYVYLLKNGKEVEQAVTVGAAGGTYTQVLSGLKSGQEVVIASLSSKVPSTGSSSSGRTGLGGGSGFGGGGFGGGSGFGGAATGGRGGGLG